MVADLIAFLLSVLQSFNDEIDVFMLTLNQSVRRLRHVQAQSAIIVSRRATEASVLTGPSCVVTEAAKDQITLLLLLFQVLNQTWNINTQRLLSVQLPLE